MAQMDHLFLLFGFDSTKWIASGVVVGNNYVLTFVWINFLLKVEKKKKLPKRSKLQKVIQTNKLINK